MDTITDMLKEITDNSPIQHINQIIDESKMPPAILSYGETGVSPYPANVGGTINSSGKNYRVTRIDRKNRTDGITGLHVQIFVVPLD